MTVSARDAILKARAESLRYPPSAADPDEFGLLNFRAGANRYAMRSDKVAAIHRVAEFAAVPGAPSSIRGLAVLGGELHALLDIGILMKTASRGIADFRHAIVVVDRRRRLALLAAEVEGMARISPNSIQPWANRRAEKDTTGRDPNWCEGLVDGDRMIVNAEPLLDQLEAEVLGR